MFGFWVLLCLPWAESTQAGWAGGWLVRKGVVCCPWWGSAEVSAAWLYISRNSLSDAADVVVAAGVGCVASRYSVFTHHLSWFYSVPPHATSPCLGLWGSPCLGFPSGHRAQQGLEVTAHLRTGCQTGFSVPWGVYNAKNQLFSMCWSVNNPVLIWLQTCHG